MRFLMPVCFCLFHLAGLQADSNLPRSREAVFVESSSPSEVMIRATGIGVDTRRGKARAEVLDQTANEDARKAAVWFVLLGGSDPLLQTEKEKSAFRQIEENFFAAENILKYIAWEAEFYESRLKIDGGKRLKITKTFRVQKSRLQKALSDHGILAEKSALMQSVGLPSIMVIPERTDEGAPIELLQTEPLLKKGAEIIEAYLSARRYQVIVPEQQQSLQQLSATQYAMAGSEEDYSYLLALSIGSDVYISYNVKLETRQLASTEVRKAIVGCRAYETTTGRLLGTETGYSEERPAAEAALVEEAMNDAIDRVLSRISNYWKKDLSQGIQYKVLFTISQDYEIDTAEKIIFQLADLLKTSAKTLKENAIADYTYDVSVWVDPQRFSTTTDVYRYLKTNYQGLGRMERVSINRKLILLNIAQL